jgi:hypothetical protein
MTLDDAEVLFLEVAVGNVSAEHLNAQLDRAIDDVLAERED